MRLGSARAATILAFAFATVLACLRPLGAHELSVQGLVLGLDPAHGVAIVRVGQGGSRSSLIRKVRLVPATLARTLAVGQTLSATLDEDATPWTLSDVSAGAKQALVGAVPPPPAILRDVPHVTLGERLPQGKFVDQTGRPFDTRELAGKPAVLAFVYTRCADTRVCPLISARFAQLQAKLSDSRAQLIEITLDPAYDRPEVLAHYGKIYGTDAARWKLLTGDPDAVLNYAARFGVTAFPDRRIGLIHDERTVLIDSNGEVRQLIDENSWSPDEIVAQLRADQHQASNPFARLNLWLSSTAVAVCGNSVAGFSGLADLAVVCAIFGGFGWLMFRIARGIRRSA
jgi:protein SCO1/2